MPVPLAKANTIHNVTVSSVQTRTQCVRRDLPQDRNSSNEVAQDLEYMTRRCSESALFHDLLSESKGCLCVLVSALLQL